MGDQLQDHHLKNVGSRETHRVAPGHHERFRKPERIERLRPDELVEELGLQPGQTVIDLGCGDGLFFGPLSRVVGEEGTVIGLDIEEEMVKVARETVEKENLGNVQVQHCSDDSLPLPEDSSDGALLVNSLHEMASPEQTLAELRRILRDGATVLVYDRHREETGPEGPPIHHLVSEEQAVNYFNEAGFASVRTIDWDPDMYTMVFQ